MLLANPLNWFRRTPAPPAFGKDKIVPQDEASLLSKLTFEWLAPFLYVGASRPLEKDDLWSLPPRRRTHALTNLVEAHFYARIPSDKRPSSYGKISGAAAHKCNSKDLTGTDVKDSEKSEKIAEATPLDSIAEQQLKEKKRFRSIPFTRKKASGPETSVKTDAQTKYPKRPLLSAIHAAFFWRWWSAGLLKLCADTLRTTSPLLTKLLLAWLTEAFVFSQSGGTSAQPRGIGYGIGLGISLFVMQEAASLMTNHFMMTTMTNGLCARSALIGAIFRKSLRLSGRARAKHSVGQMTTMISTDTTRLDLSAAVFHDLWIAPIQIIIGIALLINNLGYSALVGLGVLILGFPIQFVLVHIMFRSRSSGVQITDRRVRLTNEVLQGIRLIKLYAWEAFYAHRIGELREKEIAKIRRYAIAQAGLIAVVTIIPILATVLSFITYALSGHDLNPAIIFSSLQFFNVIRAPLIFFPMVLSSVSDAVVALGRIGAFLMAEELEEPYAIDNNPSNKYAIRVEGSFTWETVDEVDGDKFGTNGAKGHGGGKEDKARKPESVTEALTSGKGASAGRKRRWTGNKPQKDSVLPSPATAGTSAPQTGNEGQMSGFDIPAHQDENNPETPFALTDLKLRIPKRQFVAIVGRVGSGKSSLLQSLIGEMRKVDGEVVFGGSVAYVPQQPWIMNATLRENIVFGREDDEMKFDKVIQACCLQHDIEMLPNGVDTEIGEKGINLSGGQKARVSLARAAYSDSDIILLDDPLSAVDAHVGKAILEDCLLSGPLANKTRVLVTHALHVLTKTDYIYTMGGGKILEEGNFQNLMRDGREFARLLDEFGVNEEIDSNIDAVDVDANAVTLTKSTGPSDQKKAQVHLISEEEHNKGAIPLATYKQYLKYAGGIIWAPLIILLLTLTEGASVGNNLFLGFWTALSIPNFSEGAYMGVYAALGVVQAILSFITSFTFSLVGLYASLRLFKGALKGVLHSPVSFFDTTPMGRIVSRLSKDQDTLDTQLSMVLFQLLIIFSSVLGTVALVFYTFPYLGIIFAPISIMYYVVQGFYRRSSVETKRLDSLMRSALYASYSETLTGLATVRAYREQGRFVNTAEQGLDLENRAYYMTVAIQRWLSVRLDLFGNFLILGIALFAAGFRNSVDPSKVGVVLTYSLSITQVFAELVNQFAQNEQNMNAVERVLVYVDLPQEGTSTTPVRIPPSWPDEGELRFKNVSLAYREGLPLVLKNVSFEVSSGEKVGIVGRTGAGKSSLLQALFRMVELRDGTIEIDGINTRSVDLETLRTRLALVPQDATLFLGTLRDNLDPQNSRTDAEIISALRRSWLIPPEGTPMDPSSERKFSLDAPVSDEGSNYSAGEKQLLALSRALLKNSRIIVLDEATSSVDVETDAKLQMTIQKEFSSCTLLCIAHRLKTIVYYDRILVMDGGMVAEFETPLVLFDREDSIFRSLCDEAGLSRQDIVRIREGVQLNNDT